MRKGGGEGVLREHPFHGGGINIFWNYTMCFKLNKPISLKMLFAEEACS